VTFTVTGSTVTRRYSASDVDIRCVIVVERRSFGLSKSSSLARTVTSCGRFHVPVVKTNVLSVKKVFPNLLTIAMLVSLDLAVTRTVRDGCLLNTIV